jgi:quercetin dioxygenase-like cupin family protein
MSGHFSLGTQKGEIVKSLLFGIALIVSYVVVSSAIHFVVIPEQTPPLDDRPRSGSVVRLPGGSTFTFLVTGIESFGEVMRAEWVGGPEAGIARHIHPSQEVSFQVTQGALRVVRSGEEIVVEAGDTAVIPRGAPHAWENAIDGESRGVFQIRPAGMSDFVFVQLDRAFKGGAGPGETALQTAILIGTHGKHTAWPIRAIRFLAAPTARLFGYRSYYPSGDER